MYTELEFLRLIYKSFKTQQIIENLCYHGLIKDINNIPEPYKNKLSKICRTCKNRYILGEFSCEIHDRCRNSVCVNCRKKCQNCYTPICSKNDINVCSTCQIEIEQKNEEIKELEKILAQLKK